MMGGPPEKVGLIVAGGGTGGHVLAGVAIADEWKKHGPAGARGVLFVGSQSGIENRLVPRAGYPLKTLKIGSLNRVSLRKRLLTLIQLPGSLVVSAMILLRARPRAVIGVGGYSSGPLVMMARLLGPLIGGARVAILEQNAVPGLTNRLLGRVAQRVLLAFPIQLPASIQAKSRVTGNPVRQNLVPASRKPDDGFTLFIFGGSQGAAGINTLVIDALPHLQDLLPRLRWIHQTGEQERARVLEAYARYETQARVEAFIDDMAECYRRASLVICRAGSSTLSELAAVGRAAILVPFPFASDNHQEKNARLFVDHGGAVLLKQTTSTGHDLAVLIRDHFENAQKIAAMEEKVLHLAKRNAAEAIVRELER